MSACAFVIAILVRIAERAMIGPSEGLRRLEGIMRKPSRYGTWVRTLGHAVLAMGLGMILEGSFSALVTCFSLGFLVAGLNALSHPFRQASTCAFNALAALSCAQRYEAARCPGLSRAASLRSSSAIASYRARGMRGCPVAT